MRETYFDGRGESEHKVASVFEHILIDTAHVADAVAEPLDIEWVVRRNCHKFMSSDKERRYSGTEEYFAGYQVQERSVRENMRGYPGSLFEPDSVELPYRKGRKIIVTDRHCRTANLSAADCIGSPDAKSTNCRDCKNRICFGIIKNDSMRCRPFVRFFDCPLVGYLN